MTNEQEPKIPQFSNDNHYYTEERIINELNYRQAQRIAELLFDEKLINPKEYEALSNINRASYPPLFVEIFPK
jgi:transcriptional regulator CtsR